MRKTARQLKDLIRNLSREKSADAQLLMRNYMMEVHKQFLRLYHIQLSCYIKNFSKAVPASEKMCIRDRIRKIP